MAIKARARRGEEHREQPAAQHPQQHEGEEEPRALDPGQRHEGVVQQDAEHHHEPKIIEDVDHEGDGPVAKQRLQPLPRPSPEMKHDVPTVERLVPGEGLEHRDVALHIGEGIDEHHEAHECRQPQRHGGRAAQEGPDVAEKLQYGMLRPRRQRHAHEEIGHEHQCKRHQGGCQHQQNGISAGHLHPRINQPEHVLHSQKGKGDGQQRRLRQRAQPQQSPESRAHTPLSHWRKIPPKAFVILACRRNGLHRPIPKDEAAGLARHWGRWR